MRSSSSVFYLFFILIYRLLYLWECCHLVQPSLIKWRLDLSRRCPCLMYVYTILHIVDTCVSDLFSTHLHFEEEIIVNINHPCLCLRTPICWITLGISVSTCTPGRPFTLWQKMDMTTKHLRGRTRCVAEWAATTTLQSSKFIPLLS